MKLVGRNKCPVCGKEFKVQGDCRINPNPEFYGGRVKFFQQQTCDCFAVYDLLISETINGLKVIDLDLIKYGQAITPVEETKPREANENEKVVIGEDYKGNDIVIEKKTLAILPDHKQIRDKLELLTKQELMKKADKVGAKYSKSINKMDLIDALFEADPTGMKL